MDIQLITQREDVMGLESAWHELSEESLCSDLFTSFDWMSTWWDCLGADMQLMVFVLWAGSIIGIVPLMKVRKFFWKFPYDEVYLLSATANPFSPRAFAGSLDFLIRNGFAAEHERFIRYLLTSFKGWNYLKLHPLPENSPSLAIFRRIADEMPQDIAITRVFENACINADGPWDEYYAGRSSVFRKNNDRRYRRLMELHRTEFIEYRRPTEMDQALTDILTIERKSWKAKEGVTIDDPRNRDFYFSLVRKFSEKEMTRIWVLKIDGIPAAYDLNIQQGKCIKSLKSSYNEDLSVLSPGIILNYVMYQQLFQEGIQCIDLLFGNLAYKQRWSNSMVPHYGVYLKHHNLYTRVIDECMKSPHLQSILRKKRAIAKGVKENLIAPWTGALQFDQEFLS